MLMAAHVQWEVLDNARYRMSGQGMHGDQGRAMQERRGVHARAVGLGMHSIRGSQAFHHETYLYISCTVPHVFSRYSEKATEAALKFAESSSGWATCIQLAAENASKSQGQSKLGVVDQDHDHPRGQKETAVITVDPSPGETIINCEEVTDQQSPRSVPHTNGVDDEELAKLRARIVEVSAMDGEKAARIRELELHAALGQDRKNTELQQEVLKSKAVSKLQKEVDELKEEIENLEAASSSGSATQAEMQKLRAQLALEQEVK